MVANTGQKARLFDLWVSVSEMVRSGKRDAGQVAQTLQVVKDDPDFAKRFLAPPANSSRVKPKDLKTQLTQWNVLYSREFGFSLDISRIRIPERVEGLDCLMVVAQGMTPEKIVQALKRYTSVGQYEDNLNTVTSVRKTNQSYAIWVRDRQETDLKFHNKSANQLTQEGINGITLEERLLLELKCYLELGLHLDIKHITLCVGSRYPNGYVPYVYWDSNSREVSVDWYGSDDASGNLRSRQVVS